MIPLGWAQRRLPPPLVAASERLPLREGPRGPTAVQANRPGSKRAAARGGGSAASLRRPNMRRMRGRQGMAAMICNLPDGQRGPRARSRENTRLSQRAHAQRDATRRRAVSLPLGRSWGDGSSHGQAAPGPEADSAGDDRSPCCKEYSPRAGNSATPRAGALRYRAGGKGECVPHQSLPQEGDSL